MVRKNEVVYGSWLVVALMICSSSTSWLVDAGRDQGHPTAAPAPGPGGILVPRPEVNPFLAYPSVELEPIVITKEAEKCWKSLWRVQGCADGILKGYYGFSGVYISHECCKAFVAIDPEDCWALMFPFHPIYPRRLEVTCFAHI